MPTPIELIQEQLKDYSQKYPQGLPDFKNTKTIVVTSDYSGEHSAANYHVISYLLSSLEHWSAWEDTRINWRKKYLPDGRRLSFKNMGDSKRQKALMPFLSAANDINGILVSVAINRSMTSLFQSGSPLDLNNNQFAAFRLWKPKVLEKAGTIIHILSAILAIFCYAGQNVLWFTDEDSIAANPKRVKQLTNLFVWIFSYYLSYNLGHIRVGSTKCDNGTKQIEDLAAIPDLVAGAICEQMNLEQINMPCSGERCFFMARGDFTSKTSEITWWLSSTSHNLKRIIFFIDPKDDNCSVSLLHFYNQI